VSFDGESVSVWDTRVPGGAPLIFSNTEWAAFVAGVRRGEFDLERESSSGRQISPLDDDEP
jgi:hypothetical protein